MKTLDQKNILVKWRGSKMNKKLMFTLGNVSYYLDTVYLEYEQPELFSVVDAIGTSFLVLLTNEDEGTWLMAPISTMKLRKMEYGEINIRDPFSNPELGYIIRVKLLNDHYIGEMVSPEQIEEKELPYAEAKMNWNNMPVPSVAEELIELSHRRQKEIFDIRIVSDKTQDHTIGSKELASLLLVVNDVVANVAKVYNKGLGRKRGLTTGCGLRYVGSYAGSFGIRLEGEEFVDLADETKLTPVLKKLFEMLDKKEEQEIACMVKESSFDYTKAFRKLLKYSSDNNATLEFSYTTPCTITQRKALWENGFSKETLIFLDKLIKNEVKEEEYIGDLISVSTKQNNFGFITDTQEEITGKIDETLREYVFKVKCRAKIKVQKTVKITTANETEEKYKLMGIEEIV